MRHKQFLPIPAQPKPIEVPPAPKPVDLPRPVIPVSLQGLFEEAIVWGSIYGPQIKNLSQFEDMRTAEAKALVERATNDIAMVCCLSSDDVARMLGALHTMRIYDQNARAGKLEADELDTIIRQKG